MFRKIAVGVGLVLVLLAFSKGIFAISNVFFGTGIPSWSEIGKGPTVPQKPGQSPDVKSFNPGEGSPEYRAIDRLANEIRPESCRSVADLVSAIAAFQDLTDTGRVRVAFVWIARHIRYDKTRINETTASEVLESRRALCAGFATLFDEVCEGLGVECEVITGIIPQLIVSPGEVFENRHAWNAVRLDGNWSLVDVTWASDHDDSYFLVAPKSFIYTHFPDGARWQFLGDHPWPKSKFDNLPLIKPRFFRLGLECESHHSKEIRGGKVRLVFRIDPKRKSLRLLPEISDPGGDEQIKEQAKGVVISNGRIPDQPQWEIVLDLDALPKNAPRELVLVIYGDDAPLNSAMPDLILYQIAKSQ